jgi:hypothetical protein
LLIEPGSLHKNPGEEHRDQDGISHPWRADGRKLVAEGDHCGVRFRRVSPYFGNLPDGVPSRGIP